MNDTGRDFIESASPIHRENVMMKKSDFKIVHGNRQELEIKLLHALFTPGDRKTVEMLSQQLARKGQGRLQAVKAALPQNKARHPRAPNDE